MFWWPKATQSTLSLKALIPLIIHPQKLISSYSFCGNTDFIHHCWGFHHTQELLISLLPSLLQFPLIPTQLQVWMEEGPMTQLPPDPTAWDPPRGPWGYLGAPEPGATTPGQAATLKGQQHPGGSY